MEDCERTDNVALLLSQLRHKGIRLWVDGDTLRYQASKGGLTPSDIATLRTVRAEIIHHLLTTVSDNSTMPLLRPRTDSNLAPLTFSQQCAWNRENGGARFRVVYTATHLCGHLDVGRLRNCILELTARHESLRSRIVTSGITYRQEVKECPADVAEVVDLTITPENRRVLEAKRLIKALIATPVDAAVGPLFESKLFKLSDNEHVLATVTDHLFSDDASTCILLHEAFSGYARLQCRDSSSFKRAYSQLADYAIWQQKATSWWRTKHYKYWSERFSGASRLRILPTNRVSSRQPAVEVRDVHFGKEVSATLRELGRQEKATLAIATLAAYVAFLSNWCGSSDIVISFLALGRDHPCLQHAIGMFVFPLYLRIELGSATNFRDLIRLVINEYGRAQEHSDAGLLGAHFPPLPFEPNTSFNWVPSEMNANSSAFIDTLNSDLRDNTLRLRPFEIENACEGIDFYFGDREPILALTDENGEISGSIIYTDVLSPSDIIPRFENSLSGFIKRLAKFPDDPLLQSTGA